MWRIRIAGAFLCACFLCVSFTGYAKDATSDVRVGPGMEARKHGDMNIIVPKGGKFYTEPGRIYLESSDEYAARMFVEMEERLKAIEADQEEMKREIAELRGSLRDLEGKAREPVEPAEGAEAAPGAE